MESDALDRAIEEELEKLSLNLSDFNSDDSEPEEDFTESNEKLENDLPDPVFTYLEASHDRMKSLELILEDLDENDSPCNETSHQIHFEDLLNERGCSPKEDLMMLKERILSQIEEHVTHPGDANGSTLEPTAHVNDETKCDAYKETEEQFICEWRAMEERLRKEEEQRLAEQEAEREHHLNSVKEEEEKKKHRFEEFEEELRTMSRMSSCGQPEDNVDGQLEQLHLEEVKQQELIKQLEEQLEKEKRVFEEAQQEEKKRTEMRRCGAATKLQAAFRGALVRLWSKKELSKRKEEERRRQEEENERKQQREKEERMRKESEEKRRRTVEEERRQKKEQERRRAEYERAKEQERHRLEKERKLEEQRRREKEAKRMEDERKQKEEEEKRMRVDEERKEAEKRRAEEKERRRKEEEERRKRMDKERKENEKRRAEEKERMRKEVEEERRKRNDEDRIEEKKMRAEVKEKRIKEEEKWSVEKERIRKEDEDQRKSMDVERIEWEKKRAEQKEKKIKKDEDRRKRMDEVGKEEEKRRVEEKVWSTTEEEEEEKKKNTEESRQVQKERETINEDGSKSKEINMKDERSKRKEEESIVEGKRTVDKEERNGKGDTRRKMQEKNNTKQLETMQEGKQIKLEEKKSNGGEEKVPKMKEEGEKDGRITLTHPISSSDTTAPTHTSTFPAAACLDGAKLQYEADAEKSKTNTRGRLGYPMSSMEKCPQESNSTCLPENTELKRLAWMMNCVPWSKLSMQNKRKRVTASTRKREARRTSMPSLPPLSVDTILTSGSWSTLKQVTTVTLEDLPGCSLSPLTECTSLQSLTLRRCGLQALEALNRCSGLKHIDVQENSITYVNLGSLDRLEVLLLGKNKLTSIHGLDGAVNLTVLQLSYNTIFRISGLGSLKRLQRLSVDHNHLISTRGLSDAFTLLHLDCSYNHLSHVEGLEHCALLNTLDLRGNSLSEIPVLKDHVLLRELYLDDNSISSLHGLDSCWLPLLRCLSVAQNNVTQLPLLDDLLSLKILDISHNCLSELKNICLSILGCTRLQELNISDNPVEQENNWRSSILAVMPNLIKLNDEQTGASVEPSVGPTQLWSFQALCQAHQDELDSVLEKHSMEINMAPTVLDAHLLASNHSAVLLRLAEQQRYAHEYGDSSVSDTAPQEPAASSWLQAELNWDLATNDGTQQHAAEPDIQSQPGAHLPGNIHKAHLDHPKADIPSECADGCITPSQQFREQQSRPCRRATETLRMDLKTMAAMVIQRCWRKYRRTGPSEPPAPPKSHGMLSPQRRVGSSGRRIEPPNKDYAATVIQAIWRGYALRRRLACALALAQVSEGDEAFEEVDMDEFIFDEETMENDWIPLHSEASLSGLPKYSEQLLLPKPPPPMPELHKNTLELPWKTRQAFVASEGAASTEQSLPQDPNTRRPSPPSSLRLGALPERSEKILKEWGINSDSTALLILKRAQKMKGRKQQQQRKLLDPVERLALFKKSSKQPVPVETHKRYQAECRDEIKGAVGRGEVSVGDISSREPRQMQQPGTYQWLRTQAVQSHRSSATSERDHFLPEIDPEILNGGRVQLLAGTRYRESPDSAGRLWSDATGFSSHHNHQDHIRRHSVDYAKKEVPSPKRVTSAPARKERISFRDNPVQLSGGWGGGKKRARVNK